MDALYGQRIVTAAGKLRRLLEWGYPRERVLDLVGDRHDLDADQRHVLRRGVCAPARAAERKARRVGLAACAGRMVGVDGHNVLITLESALRGGRLVLADDGFVRDIAGLGRNHRPGPDTRRAAEMMLGVLAGAGAAGAEIWLDAPLPRSGEVAAEIRGMMAAMGLSGSADAVPVPERELAGFAGPVASSDSAVIDEAGEPLDLAGEVLAGWPQAPALLRLG